MKAKSWFFTDQLFIVFLLQFLHEKVFAAVTIEEELQILKDGIANGFGEQWKILQKIRYQGLKRHVGIINIFKEVQDLKEQVQMINKKLNSCQRKERNNDTFVNDSNLSCRRPYKYVDGHCVFMGKEIKSWENAHKICKKSGGHLFDGRDEEAYSAIMKYIREELMKKRKLSGVEQYVWVGGRNVEGEWNWVNGKGDLKSFPIDAKFWAPREPRKRIADSNKFCVALNSRNDFKAITRICKFHGSFVCSYDHKD